MMASSRRVGAACVFQLVSVVLTLCLWADPIKGDSHKLCSRCPGDLRNGTAVFNYCHANSTLVADGRCCVQKQARQEVVGLDLWNCSITKMEELLKVASTLVVLDLSDNPFENISFVFRGFTRLQEVVLPVTIDCPEGAAAWRSITLEMNKRICQGQKNTCNGTTEPSNLCPEYSVCEPDGPGLFQCSCIKGQHGYKCLRQDGFPMWMFLGIVGAGTMVITVFLWVTQRRKVKTM
ncbi:all-trans retinoic acid-induced differentiation factor [Callorhinchus milii]|uniref:EGF-like domain-containing protein n=1 Tax=Callorhinchus milii TaxID=7868 RepID=A0A4W3J5F1_CALMI|nr:all-trans retinoic acid-induced differentiation factor [Callorhinchus milii]|eukprot:gi/632951218/ref/XP_007891168.1/ PREDICTED: all-trans retinoic acid-induced differentiation factor [Callorhinchus milii]